VSWAIAGFCINAETGGKSELQRAERWVTPRCREAMESATENKPPKFFAMKNR